VVNQAVADQIVANQVIANQVIAMERLKRRTDFRAAAAGLRAPGRTFVLQARQRAEAGPVRIGFTVSKQVGNAVKRNRVRRRLRETVRLAPPAVFHAGHDYVLIGRRTALEAPFAEIARELDVALNRIHAPEPAARGGTGGAHQRPLHEAGSPRPKPRRQSRDASAKD
jgi:ribonuclease P protein component